MTEKYPQNDIDFLMSKQPPWSDAELDAIIAYNRNSRAAKEASGRGSRAKKDAGPPLDLEKLGLKITKPKVERRL